MTHTTRSEHETCACGHSFDDHVTTKPPVICNLCDCERDRLTTEADALADRVVLDGPAPTHEAHEADWSDSMQGEPPSCSCGYNGTPEECATSRQAPTQATEGEA